MVAVALIIAGVLFVRSQLGEGGELLGPVVAEIEVAVEGPDGAAPTPGDLDVARQVAVARLDNADIHPVAVEATSSGLLVRLGEGVSEADIARAEEILAWPETIEFREVLEVSVGDDVGVCAERQGRRPEDQITLCDREHSALYELGPAEMEGPGIASVSLTELTPGSEDWAVTIFFTDEGAADLERVSARLAQSGGQLAFVVADEVISAPRVMSALTGTDMQISGSFDRTDAEALAREIDLARHGMVFSVVSVQT